MPAIVTYDDLRLLVNADPSKIDNSKLPITPIEALHPTGITPNVDISKYTLTIDGLVNHPLSLSYGDILKYPTVSQVVLLICPDTFVDNAKWTGIPMTTLLAKAGIKSEASTVTFYAMDGYYLTFPIKDIQQPGVFMAYKVNDQTLTPDAGYPIRLVMKGKYGSNWVKWVNHIEIK